MNQVIVMAGGKGTRMNMTDIPKTMIRVEGKPIVEYIVEAAESAVPETKPVVIVGFQGHTIQAYLGDRVTCVEQKEQLGTGHAVACAAPLLRDRSDIKYVIVLAGDQPLISADTIRTVLDHHKKCQETITLGTVVVPDYSGIHEHLLHYGRIIRKEDGTVERIVEYKDATEEERAIREVNTSVYCFDADWLWSHIDKLGSDNASKEFYITDLIGMAQPAYAKGSGMAQPAYAKGSGMAQPAYAKGSGVAKEKIHAINAIPLPDPLEGLNVNTPEQLTAIGGVFTSRVQGLIA